MTKLIADFRNFANPPSNAENIAQTVTFALTWEVCDYHLGRNTHTHTCTHTPHTHTHTHHTHTHHTHAHHTHTPHTPHTHTHTHFRDFRQ